jgi:hypothetical protein
MSGSPSITNGKVSSGNSNEKALKEAVERGELSHELREFLDEIGVASDETTYALITSEVDGSVESIDDLPEEVVENAEQLTPAELEGLPDEVLDELPDDVTADVNYDTSYDDIVGDDVDWDAAPSGSETPHPESAEAAHDEQLEQARQDDHGGDWAPTNTPADTGQADLHDASRSEQLVRQGAEGVEELPGVDGDYDTGDVAVDNEGQALDGANHKSAGDPELDAAQGGQLRGTGSDTGEWRLQTSGNITIEVGSDAAGQRLRQMYGSEFDSEMHPHIDTGDGIELDGDPEDFIDITPDRIALADKDLEQMVHNGRALPRPPGSDAFVNSSIAGREVSVEKTRQAVFDMVESEVDGVDPEHMDQLTEEQRAEVMDAFGDRIQSTREDVSTTSEWKPLGFQFEDEISAEEASVPAPVEAGDETATWFHQHRFDADFEMERTKVPTSDNVTLVKELAPAEARFELGKHAGELSSRPNAPSEATAYRRMVSAYAAGADPEDAARMVKRSASEHLFPESDVNEKPAVVPAKRSDIKELHESGVEKVTVEGTVTDVDEGRNEGQFQWARLSTEDAESINFHISERAHQISTPLKPGDKIRVSKVAPDEYTDPETGNTYQEVSATGYSHLTLLEEDHKIDVGIEQMSREEAPRREMSRPKREMSSSSAPSKLPNALGAESPISDREPDYGQTIDDLSKGRGSKTSKVRHTAEDSRYQQDNLIGDSRFEDPEWERAHEQPAEDLSPDESHPARGASVESADQLFHDCGTMLKTNPKKGSTVCTNENCGGRIQDFPTTASQVKSPAEIGPDDNPGEARVSDFKDSVQPEMTSSLDRHDPDLVRETTDTRKYKQVVRSMTQTAPNSVTINEIADNIVDKQKTGPGPSYDRDEILEHLQESVLPEIEDKSAIGKAPETDETTPHE